MPVSDHVKTLSTHVQIIHPPPLHEPILLRFSIYRLTSKEKGEKKQETSSQEQEHIQLIG